MTAAGFRLPGGESTSAQLGRISQERTQLAVALRALREELKDTQTALAAERADRTEVERQRDEARQERDRLLDRLGEITDQRAGLL